MIDNVQEIDSKVLAAHIVAYRVLGVDRERAKECMEELYRRKETGDAFNYEDYIEEKLSTMPKLTEPGQHSKIQSILSRTELRNRGK